MIEKKSIVMVVVLASLCACMGQEVLPPLPEDAIEMGADVTIESQDDQTGDVTLQYTLILKNISDETLEKVILQDFDPPSDVIMEQDYFEVYNLSPGQTTSVTFRVLVEGWGLDPKDQSWLVAFTLRIEKGSAYTEQISSYEITLYT